MNAPFISTKLQIFVFVCLATVFSGLTRAPFFGFYRGDEFSIIESFALVALLIGWGPALASYFTIKLSQTSNNTFSILGNWSFGSLISIAVLPVTLMAVGLSNDSNINPHMFGLIIGLCLVLYTLGEEIGWRGYLSKQLNSHTSFVRAFIIGTIWWFWHLSFLSGSLEEGITLTGSITGHFTYWAILVAVSALFNSLVERNKSVLQVAAFHAVGNVAVFAGGLSFVAQSDRWGIAGFSLTALLVIDFIWQKRFKTQVITT